MAAKKNSTIKVEVLTRLDYDQCVESLRQFETAYPKMRSRREFLGLAVSMEAGEMAIKLTVTQLGEQQFVEAMALPQEFEAEFAAGRATLKVLIKGAPILTSAAPKSAAGKKTAPVFPTSR